MADDRAQGAVAQAEAGGPARARVAAQRSLGLALALRAEECGELVTRRMAAQRWHGPRPSLEYMRLVDRINWFATVLIARWLAHGQAADDAEKGYIAARGRMAAAEQLSIVNVTRAYLIWRDTTGEILREEAQRLGTAREVLAEALRVVRASCDASLIRVAAAFDESLESLVRTLEAERRLLSHQALHDSLTGLPNRVLLYDRLEQAVVGARRSRTEFALLLLDLDGFKRVNDTWGHRCGDMVLEETGARLLRGMRGSDTVARFGGDEFIAVLPDTGRRGASRVAQKILRAVAEPIHVGAMDARLGASVGVAVYPGDGVDSQSLIAAADRAMYRAKRRRARS